MHQRGRRNVATKEQLDYAKGIDAIKEVSPELADKILKPEPPDWKLWPSIFPLF